jgi:ribosome-associated protein
LAELAAAAAQEKKATDVLLLDVRKKISFVDYLVFCGADSSPQIEAICREISEQLKTLGTKGLRWQGSGVSGWALIDLGGVVVHVLNEEARERYRLEELWGEEAVVYHY